MFEIPFILEMGYELSRAAGYAIPNPGTVLFFLCDVGIRGGYMWADYTAEYLAEHPELLEKFLEIAEYYY